MKPIDIVKSVVNGYEQSVIEMDIAPGTGNPAHYHTLFKETFEVVRGELHIKKGTEKALLREGDQVSVPPGVAHSFNNQRSEACRIRVTLQPGSKDFEDAMLIYYGLQEDGLLRKSGTPKSIKDLALFLELNNSNMNGPGKVVSRLFHTIAERAIRQGRLDRLRDRYSLSQATKALILLFILSHLGMRTYAQNALSQTTQVEVGLGYTRPFLTSGKELTRAQQLRDQGQSYYENEEGVRKKVGQYPDLSGYAFTIGFNKPLTKVAGLLLGAVVRNAQTGSQPKDGGYEEAYYFNFITGSAAIKYYPITSRNLFVKGEVGLASVLTKNRFINSQGEQHFFHQFGIGSAAALGVGYAFLPFANQSKALEIQAVYQQLGTRVEVNGIGDDRWRFGALQVSAILIL